MTYTVSEALLAIMKAHGIRHVFGVPAAQLGHVMKGLWDCRSRCHEDGAWRGGSLG